MSGAPIVAVRGEVVREADPELATFSVSARARDSGRDTTIARLTQRHDDMRATLDRYAGAIERRETSGVSVYPENKRSGERIRAYTGSVTTTVTVADFAVLGELMLLLADADQVAVTGPWWSLRPASPVYAEARQAAVGEAIARAREYARALGAELTRLVELADTGMSSTGSRPATFQLASAEAPVAGGAGVPRFELDPQRQTVRATVEARFEITEPAALG